MIDRHQRELDALLEALGAAGPRREPGEAIAEDVLAGRGCHGVCEARMACALPPSAYSRTGGGGSPRRKRW
jgi:hypothetical protein